MTDKRKAAYPSYWYTSTKDEPKPARDQLQDLFESWINKDPFDDAPEWNKEKGATVDAILYYTREVMHEEISLTQAINEAEKLKAFEGFYLDACVYTYLFIKRGDTPQEEAIKVGEQLRAGYVEHKITNAQRGALAEITEAFKKQPTPTPHADELQLLDAMFDRGKIECFYHLGMWQLLGIYAMNLILRQFEPFTEPITTLPDTDKLKP
jgi:hypothetical protein